MIQATYPFYKGWLANGIAPAAGGLLYTYYSGGTISKTTYSDINLTIPNTNPIVLNASGEATIFLAPGDYRFDLKTSLGALINTFDPIKDSETIPTSISRFTLLATITHAQLQAGALTNNIQFVSLAARQVLLGLLPRVTIAFAGTSITSYSLSLGITADLTRFFPDFNAMLAGHINGGAIQDCLSFIDATSLRIAATSVGANLTASTAGEIEIYGNILTLPET